MIFKPTDCILVLGRRGCGKSYLAKKVQDIWPRRLIIDTMNEYQEGGEIVRGFEEYCAKILEFKAKKIRKFVIIFKFPLEGQNKKALFNEILRIAYFTGYLQIVIEEIQIHSTPHWMPLWLENCLLVGRHQGISILGTSQRPGEVHKTIVSQCQHIFCGNIIDQNDRNYVANFLGEDSEKLKNLPDRHFIYFSGGKTSEITNDI